MGIVEDIFNVKVPPESMMRALEIMSEMIPEDRRDMTARAISIIAMIEEEFPGHSVDLSAAIEFRLEALAKLDGSPQLKPWSMIGKGEGLVHISPDVLRVAAAEPLIEGIDKRPAFNPESFFKHLMYISDEEGAA